MRTAAAIALSSLLTALSFPAAYNTDNLIPAWISFTCSWFFLVPLLRILRNTTPGHAFRMTYLYGLLANSLVFYWITIAMRKYGNLSWPTSLSIMGSLVCALALYPALAVWMSKRLRTVAPEWLVGAIFLTCLEWTRVYMPLEGYPWGTPAYGLYGAKNLIQISDVTGVVGLNLMIYSCNFLLAGKPALRPGNHLHRASTIALSIALVASYTYGCIRIPSVREASNQADPLKVALLQGNIPQELKWEAGHREHILDTYQRLSRIGMEANAQLIVWPEAAYPVTVHAETKKFRFLREQESDADYVIGASTWDRKNGKKYYMNSAFVIGGDGTVQYRYDKQHLVPFGEYVPLADVLPMDSVVPNVAGNFQKGNPTDVPQTHGVPFGILICYESLFPDIAVEHVRRGAKILVNITNDAWFDRTSGPFQHVNFNTFRAIETRRSIVRAANTGISAWYDPMGFIHDTTNLFDLGWITTEIPLMDARTFYVRHPQLIIRVCFLILALISVGVFRRFAEKDE